MVIQGWGWTDVGRERDHNEDALLIDCELGLFAVADGMGGHSGGDRASRIAIDTLQRVIREASLKPAPAKVPEALGAEPADPADDTDEDDEDTGGDGGRAQDHGADAFEAVDPPARALEVAAQQAGRAIHEAALDDPALSGMGTTLTAVLLLGRMTYVGHVGDSRAYLYRGDKLERLTVDHTWIEEQVRAGFMSPDEAQRSELRHIVTRSVGYDPEVRVDLMTLPAEPNDCYLLCSDGLTNYLDDDALLQMIKGTAPAELPERLVAEANRLGGEDNISVIVAHLTE